MVLLGIRCTHDRISLTCMKVILTEKPSVASDLAKALGEPSRKDGYWTVGNYGITWAVGHLVEIDESIAPRSWQLSTLPILPDEFRYLVTPDKQKQFNVISQLIARAEGVVIATDAGREGELIARLILKLINYQGPLQRFWTSEALSPEVVQREMERLKAGQDYESLYYSALGRQHADWLVGINLTRLATVQSTDRSVWSIGRVQTPVLRLVVDRELEIRNFKPEPYWIIKAKFAKEAHTYQGTLLNPTKKKDKTSPSAIYDQAQAETILQALAPLIDGHVEKVKQEQKKQKPPLLHSLTTLQREANQLYSFTAKQTLDLAQELYEAKKISYPRTDAQYLDEQPETKALVKNVLTKLGKADLVPRVDKVGKAVFDTKKLTDHYALIPQALMTKADTSTSLSTSSKNLSDLHYQLYILIARRLTGAFMPDYIYETTQVTTQIGDYPFISRGRIDKQLGWKSLYQRDKAAPEEEAEDQQSLPALQPQDAVTKTEQQLDTKQTKPPDRHKESSLLGSMEKLNLGTPATRAAILETLKTRGYLKVQKKSLVPEDKGIHLIQALHDRAFTSPEMTANWEQQLHDIYKEKRGQGGYQEFLEQMKGFVQQEVESLRGVTLQGPPIAASDAPAVCEACKNLEESDKGFKCPTCQRMVWKTIAGKSLTLKQAQALLAGKTIPLKGLKSKLGKSFDAQAHWKEGRVELIFESVAQGPPLGDCPCGGKIETLEKLWKCTPCGKILWRNLLGRPLTPEEALALWQGQTILLPQLTSKAGKSFNAHGKLVDGGKVQLIFDQT